MPRVASLHSEMNTLTSIIVHLINTKGIALRSITHKKIEETLVTSKHRRQFLITIARLDHIIYYHAESDSYKICMSVIPTPKPVYASRPLKELKQLIEAIYAQKLMIGMASKEKVFDHLQKRWKFTCQRCEFLVNLGILEGVIKFNESNGLLDLTT